MNRILFFVTWGKSSLFLHIPFYHPVSIFPPETMVYSFVAPLHLLLQILILLDHVQEPPTLRLFTEYENI
jgi:hypothetical protein